MTHKKFLYKSTENKIFTGVASGIADYLSVDYITIRMLFIILAFASGIGVVLYVSLSVLLPRHNEIIDKEDDDFYYNFPTGVYMSKKQSSKKVYLDIIYKSLFNINIFAFSIIIFGFLSIKLNIIPWTFIPEIWRYPALILTVGLAFIIKSITK